MAENFYTILTAVGKNKLANSAVLGSKVNFKTLKLGDGNGTYYEPSENQTTLVNKVWEGNISSISIDENNSNWIVIQIIIPATDGGFFIREAGIFDEDGDLIAVSKISETYKPIISEGSTKDISIKIILEVSNADNIILKIDPNVVVATKNDIAVLESKMQDISIQLSGKANNTDSARTTTSKTVTGAINELNTNKANKDGTLQTSLNADTVDGKHAINLAQNLSIGIADFNTLTQSGMYRFESGNANCPGNLSYGQLLVIHGAGDTIAQICFGYSDSVAYMRTGNPSDVGGTGSWKAWKQIATADGTVISNLNADMIDGVHASKIAKFYISGNEKDISDANSKEFFMTNVINNSNAPNTDWWHIINLPHCNNDGYTSQIAVTYGNNSSSNMFFRSSLGTTWNSWKRLSITETSTFPPFLNGWTYWSDGAYGARQITKVGNLCNIDVTVMNSSPNNLPIFNITDGFRSIKSMVICGVSNSTLIPIDIYLDGTVRIKSTLPASNAWVHINATYPVA